MRLRITCEFPADRSRPDDESLRRFSKRLAVENFKAEFPIDPSRPDKKNLRRLAKKVAAGEDMPSGRMNFRFWTDYHPDDHARLANVEIDYAGDPVDPACWVESVARKVVGDLLIDPHDRWAIRPTDFGEDIDADVGWAIVKGEKVVGVVALLRTEH
jgi:hypothetical protein